MSDIPSTNNSPQQGRGHRFFVIATAALLLAMMSVSTASAGDTTLTKMERYRKSHQAGVRLGVWSNTGDLPVSLDTSGSTRYRAFVNSTSFYAEVYLGIRLLPQGIVEIAAGLANRGDVTVESEGYVYYGNISLYPISVRLKVYPLGGTQAPFQPYVMAGGGLHIGKNNIQFSDDYYAEYVERSVTDFNLVFGGGVDWPLSSKIALDAQAVYMPSTFSKELFGSSDYSGVAITVGVKYLLPTLRGKKDQDYSRRIR